MSYYTDLKDKDLVIKLMPLLQKVGWLIDPETGKLTNRKFASIVADTPWVHTRQNSDNDCNLWHHVMFNHFNFIPIGCLRCWKVVVRPGTVEDLFNLLDVQENQYDGPCKCGLEVRAYVHGNYGGYFYNNSLREGQECYKKVRKLVDDNLAPNTPVILKRGCTEFEKEHGDSHEFTYTSENAKLEKRIKGVVDVDVGGYGQPDYIKDYIKIGWIEHAYSLGDPTVFKFTDGEHIMKPYVQYQDVDPEHFQEV